MTNRYQDVVHSLFKMLETQRRSLGNRAMQLRREGKDNMQLRFTDPLEEFRATFEMLLPSKQFPDPDLGRHRLRYREDGELRDFDTLSSGEREVVTLAFDFQLRNPRDCIVLFDEPELHLVGAGGESLGGEASRITRLSRYHLENYFLDANVWAAVCSRLEGEDSHLAAPLNVEDRLIEICADHVAYAISLRVSSRIRDQVGNVSLMPKDVHGADAEKLTALITQRLKDEKARVAQDLEPPQVEELVRAEFSRISESIALRTEERKTLVPGKPIVKSFVNGARLNYGHARRLYMEAAPIAEIDPLAEVRGILEEFSGS